MRLLHNIKQQLWPTTKAWRVKVAPMEDTQLVMVRNLTTGVATINANMPQEVQDAAKSRLKAEPLHP